MPLAAKGAGASFDSAGTSLATPARPPRSRSVARDRCPLLGGKSLGPPLVQFQRGCARRRSRCGGFPCGPQM